MDIRETADFIDELNDKINNDEGKIRSLKLTFYKKRTSTKMHISIDGTYRNNKNRKIQDIRHSCFVTHIKGYYYENSGKAEHNI